jgi:hypothetical protein
MALNERNTTAGAERDPRLDRLYAQSAREEPRAGLDEAIRAAARREVQARPQALGARLRRWRLPISIAAVVVLSASVVTLMREEGADRLEEGLSTTTAEPGAPAAPSVGDAKLEARESAESPDRTQVPAPQELPAPAAGLTAPSGKETQGTRRLDAPAARRAKPAEPFPAEIRQRGADAAKESASQQPEPAAEAPAKTPAPGAARALRAPAPSIQEPPTETEQDLAGKRAFNKSERSLSDSQVNALLQELDGASPEAWLEKIEALRRGGKNDAADEVETEFRRRFPKHPVPAHDGGRGN